MGNAKMVLLMYCNTCLSSFVTFQHCWFCWLWFSIYSLVESCSGVFTLFPLKILLRRMLSIKIELGKVLLCNFYEPPLTLTKDALSFLINDLISKVPLHFLYKWYKIKPTVSIYYSLLKQEWYSLSLIQNNVYLGKSVYLIHFFSISMWNLQVLVL